MRLLCLVVSITPGVHPSVCHSAKVCMRGIGFAPCRAQTTPDTGIVLFPRTHITNHYLLLRSSLRSLTVSES